MDLLEERTGAAPDNGTARVVFKAEDGGSVESGPSRRAIEAAVAELSGLAHVVAVSDPFST